MPPEKHKGLRYTVVGEEERDEEKKRKNKKRKGLEAECHSVCLYLEVGHEEAEQGHQQQPHGRHHCT